MSVRIARISKVFQFSRRNSNFEVKSSLNYSLKYRETANQHFIKINSGVSLVKQTNNHFQRACLADDNIQITIRA